MYDPPPGVKRDREKEEDEPEYKFEWQRKYNAPREAYAKGKNSWNAVRNHGAYISEAHKVYISMGFIYPYILFR